MKKYKRQILIIAGIIFLGLVFLKVYGYSEDSDPLVAQSYVELRIEQIKTYIDQKMSDMANSVNDSGNTFKPLELTKGDKLIGGEGTEIIVRVGKTKAITGADGGLVDITAGSDISNNKDILNQHLIIIPRDDGRGILVSGDKAYIMINGKYNIEK